MRKILFIMGFILISNASGMSGMFNNTTPVPKSELDIEYMITDIIRKSDEVPGRTLLEYGLRGYEKLVGDGIIEDGVPFTFIDFTLPSSEKRMWILDMKDRTVKYYEYVSHGKNTGYIVPERFSNKKSSYMSSLGFYITGEVYRGSNGKSLKLDGIEPGFNDNARERAIVIHGSSYVGENYLQRTGKLGRSLGCPALSHEIVDEVIDYIKNNTVLFIYGDDNEYITNSPIINIT
jgi:hypothetical protein